MTLVSSVKYLAKSSAVEDVVGVVEGERGENLMF